jgi:hypothetical protein
LTHHYFLQIFFNRKWQVPCPCIKEKVSPDFLRLSPDIPQHQPHQILPTSSLQISKGDQGVSGFILQAREVPFGEGSSLEALAPEPLGSEQNSYSPPVSPLLLPPQQLEAVPDPTQEQVTPVFVPVQDIASVRDAALMLDVSPVQDLAPVLDIEPGLGFTPMQENAPAQDAALAPVQDIAPVLAAAPVLDVTPGMDIAPMVIAPVQDAVLALIQDAAMAPVQGIALDHLIVPVQELGPRRSTRLASQSQGLYVNILEKALTKKKKEDSASSCASKVSKASSNND